MNRGEYLLVMLGEEASELAQRAAKCLRFGMEDVQKPDGKTYASNHDRLIAEYLDVMEVMEELITLGTVRRPSPVAVDEHLARKKARIAEYSKLSIEFGRLYVQKSGCEHVWTNPKNEPAYCQKCGVGYLVAFVNECDHFWMKFTSDPPKYERYQRCGRCGVSRESIEGKGTDDVLGVCAVCGKRGAALVEGECVDCRH